MAPTRTIFRDELSEVFREEKIFHFRGSLDVCFLPSVKLFRYTRRGTIITEALGESERERTKGQSGNSFASSNDFRHCKASKATNAKLC